MIKIFANLNIIRHLLAEQPPQENIPPQYFLIIADAGLRLRLAGADQPAAVRVRLPGAGVDVEEVGGRDGDGQPAVGDQAVVAGFGEQVQSPGDTVKLYYYLPRFIETLSPQKGSVIGALVQ